MNKKGDYYLKRMTKALDEAIEYKRNNIQKEISRRAGFNMQKPSKVQTQKYLAEQLSSQQMKFDIKAWERAVTKKIKK